jgi:hypothetical protein
MTKLVDVIATARGWDGLAVRDPGEEFQMPEGATGSWFRPAHEAPAVKPHKPVAKSAHKPRHADPPGGGDTGGEG